MDTDHRTTPISSPGRWRSIDVLRGLTVAAMIVVNNMGDGAHVLPGLAHAKWNGWTAADLIFPTFLFVMGASMALAPSSPSAWRVIRRSLTLIALGLALHAFPHLDTRELRYPGVLQRLGLTYLVASVVLRLRSLLLRLSVCIVILVSYGLALRYVAFGGHPAGTLLPTANLPGWIDRAILGWRHVYGNGGYDPEGLASTLPATVNVIIGALSIEWLRSRPSSRGGSCVRLGLTGLLLMIAAQGASHLMPINKRLWTSPFALLTCGFSITALALCVWAVDGPRAAPASSARPVTRTFGALGRNALLAFIASEELHYLFITYHLSSGATIRHWGNAQLNQLLSPDIASLTYGLLITTAFALIALLLDRRHLYVSI